MHRLNNFLSVILKLMAITAVVLFVLWFGISIYGNIVENRPAGEGPTPPSINKVPYQFTLTTTGQTLLTKSYETKAPGVYLLSGYYSSETGKWRWHKDTLKLDEYYFGDIIVERRVK